MTLATDILARSGINLAPESPKRTATRRGKIQTAAKPRVERFEGRYLHMARIYGLYHRERGWETSVFIGRSRIKLGTYPTIARARIAQKLTLYWASLGYGPENVTDKWVEVNTDARL